MRKRTTRTMQTAPWASDEEVVADVVIARARRRKPMS